jgi:hypothetical protein
MDGVLLIIILRKFWSTKLFFVMQALPIKQGAYVDDQN